MLLNLIILSCTIYSVIGQTPNYCDPALCAAGVQHIACNNNGALSINCPANTSLITLGPAQIANILDVHNKLRAKVANGLVNLLPQAARMQTLQWDPELAKLAVLNVKQCQMKHDKCRNTQTFAWSGQNLASAWTSAQQFSGTWDARIAGSINSWFNENVYATVDIINSYGPSTSVIGHFTAMSQDKSSRVGCGAIVYVSSTGANYLLACNYAYTNVLGTPVYTVGPQCSGCKSGCSTTYPGLCNTAEVVAASPY